MILPHCTPLRLGPRLTHHQIIEIPAHTSLLASIVDLLTLLSSGALECLETKLSLLREHPLCISWDIEGKGVIIF